MIPVELRTLSQQSSLIAFDARRLAVWQSTRSFAPMGDQSSHGT
jgi:hypothetical protein